MGRGAGAAIVLGGIAVVLAVIALGSDPKAGALTDRAGAGAQRLSTRVGEGACAATHAGGPLLRAVPDLVGMPLAKARRRLRSMRRDWRPAPAVRPCLQEFSFEVAVEFVERGRAGRLVVAGQHPKPGGPDEPGTLLHSGGTVTLYVVPRSSFRAPGGRSHDAARSRLLSGPSSRAETIGESRSDPCETHSAPRRTPSGCC